MAFNDPLPRFPLPRLRARRSGIPVRLPRPGLSSGRARLAVAAAAVGAELFGIGLIFKHAIAFRCLDNWPQAACAGASRSMVALYCIAAAVTVALMLRPEPLRRLLAGPGGGTRPALFNLGGVGLALAPMIFLRPGSGGSGMMPALVLWTLGTAAMLAGAGLWLARPAAWRRFAADAGRGLLPAVIAGGIAPWIAAALRPAWQIDWIADWTLAAVVRLSALLGYRLVVVDPEAKIVGGPNMLIAIGVPCSGIEGIALITIFVSLFLWLFRHELRFPAALALYPVGLAASIALNVVRITLLLIMGLNGHVELAVGGFHSHAGWIMFTVVALGLILGARRVPWWRKAPSAARPPAVPLRQDGVAARILPFAVFMLSGAVVPALSLTPGVFYPLRVVAVAGVLLMFLPHYRALGWRIAPVALAVGAAIGAVWLAVPVARAAPPFGGLHGGALTGWYVFRGLGTVLVVPLVEELFFRGYLEGRLRGPLPSAWRSIAAAAGSALPFALLHARFAEALAAALLFSWLAHRRSGRLADAVLAHALANLIVFAGAILTGRMEII